MNYLYSNELIVYVDLLDFNETWPKCSLDISAPQGVTIFRKAPLKVYSNLK